MATGIDGPKAGSRMRLSVILALLVLVGSGVGYRAVARRYALIQAAVPLECGTIAQHLPLEIDGWTGVDVPLTEGIIRATDTDDHVFRSYNRTGSREAVTLFVGYGIRLRDLMPHRPEVCYPGAGWTLVDSKTIDIALERGETLPSRVLTFSRGGLTPQRSTVLNYYLVDETYCPDVSLLRSKSWRPQTDVRYVAQVQITALGESASDDAAALVESFARDCALPLRRAITEAVRQAQGEGN